jgi:kynurenine 3-monooxygenase
VLDECLARWPGDTARAFAEYESLRKPNTDALADLALENFVEMRDKVASRAFLFRKQLDRRLHRLFPRWYVPLYTMVTFTRTPYAAARARARRQDRAVAVVAALFVLVFLAAVLGPVL